MAMEKVTSWIRGNLIGAGAYGTVNLALNNSNGQLFAVKSIECNERSRGEVEAMENELQMLQSLNSPRVIKCLGSDITSEEGKVMKNMFMEHMAGGSLADLMKSFGGQFDEALIRNFTRGILEGVHYLHSQGIVHCDIKGKNILAGSSGVKLADFGGAKRLSGDGNTRGGSNLLRVKGTPLWMAPEVASQREQGPPSDIWSLGCTVVEMATGKAPWSELIKADPLVSLYYIVHNDEVPVLPSCLSKQGQDFLSKCLQRDPRVRWTAAQLLEHPFITEEFGSVESNKVSDASFCKVEAAPRQNSPVSILESPRSSTATTNTSSSIGNSVPILQCPAFFNRLPVALNFSSKPSNASPINHQEPTTSSTSVSDFWADSPVTPQPNEWIVVRSPKTPSSAPSLSSSPSCPTRRMSAPIPSSTRSIWGGGETVVPKEKSTMVVHARENSRLTGTDALRRIFSSSDAVLQSDLRMAEAHDDQGLRPNISKIPTERIMGCDKRLSCSSSTISISSRCRRGDEGQEKLSLSSFYGEFGVGNEDEDSDTVEAVTRRRRRPRENVDRFYEQAAGIHRSSLFRGPGIGDSDPSVSTLLYDSDDYRKKRRKVLRRASPIAFADSLSEMSSRNTALARGIDSLLRVKQKILKHNTPQNASARSLTWQSQRPREEFMGNNSICSDSSISVKSSVRTADRKESTEHHSSETDSFSIKKPPTSCGSCIAYIKLSMGALWVVCFHSFLSFRFLALILIMWGDMIASSIRGFCLNLDLALGGSESRSFLLVGWKWIIAFDPFMGSRAMVCQSRYS